MPMTHRPISLTASGAKVIQDENGCVAREFDLRGNREFTLLVIHFEDRHDRPVIAFLVCNNINGFIIVSPGMV